MAHMGEEAWFEGISTAGAYPNIILDTTGSFNWYRILNSAIEMVGEDRVVFGMDFPAYNPGPELAKVTEADITEGQKAAIKGPGSGDYRDGPGSGFAPSLYARALPEKDGNRFPAHL